MGMYRVYNENYYNFGELNSVDFVEVDNTVVNCNDIYDPAVKNKLHIVNVKAADVANFIRTNKVLTITQVLQLNNKWNQGDCTFMQPYQYEQQKIKDEIRDAEEQNTFDKLHGEDNMGGSNDEFMSMLSFDRINGDTNEGRNTIIDREILDTGSFATSGIAFESTPFESKPFDFNIDVDFIFKSQPKKIDEATDVTNLDSINIENSYLTQGSCLDMFNQTVEKIGDAKIREPKHTTPAKLEKQRRIEEYHQRHNRKKNR